ncbi:MAG: hypothetical protein A2W99_09680 [Bacteroidetes bacterium GWF2_33_16]|nr:MAG: hypothetical protein A2X00_06590 [Bacteroidetes bacterium GWE2_32_14]OFY07263.1 MAG: hypothetical protein A2W99_09680 [Bacteroidetes bacterium GWF2_33_16]
MQVKGTGIKTTKEFVKINFPQGYTNWINSLTPKSRELYTGNTEFTEWFPIKDAYIEPVEKIIELFYKGDAKAAGEALGRFSADYALKGVYKVFLLVASPQFLMKRATKIMTTYYQPCEISVAENGNKSVILTISKFDLINPALEFRIGAWCQKALELTNCRNPKYNIKRALTKGDKTTEIVFSWD